MRVGSVRAWPENEWPFMRGGLVFSALVSVTLLLVGCRLPGREGPVSESLVTSRQFCQQGVAAGERGQWQRAEDLLSEAVRTCPSDPDARRHYAEALWHRGQPEEAVAELEEATRLAVDNVELHVILAEKRLAMGEVELARQSAQSAIDIEPKLARAWAARGRVRRASGRPSQALSDYHRALGLAPEDPTILLEVAEVYRELNEPQRALAVLHRLADTYSPGEEPQQVLYLQGLAYGAVKRWDEAAESLSAASIRERPTPELLFRLGEAELHAGRPVQAVTAAQGALALDPQHPPARKLLTEAELALRPEGPVRR
jgi:tetratricopeptide (TPR) repeat protein